MGIDHRGPYVAVAQKRLDRADVVIGLKKMGGEGMAEGVTRHAFGKPCLSDGFFQCFLDV
jgi:hypothetical protein